MPRSGKRGRSTCQMLRGTVQLCAFGSVNNRLGAPSVASERSPSKVCTASRKSFENTSRSARDRLAPFTRIEPATTPPSRAMSRKCHSPSRRSRAPAGLPAIVRRTTSRAGTKSSSGRKPGSRNKPRAAKASRSRSPMASAVSVLPIATVCGTAGSNLLLDRLRQAP